MLLPSISNDDSRRINEIRSTVNQYILHVSNRYNLKDYDKFVQWVDENKDLAFDYFFNGYKMLNGYQQEMIEQYKKQPIEIKKEIKEWFLNKLKTHFATIGAIGAGTTLINNANKQNNE